MQPRRFSPGLDEREAALRSQLRTETRAGILKTAEEAVSIQAMAYLELDSPRVQAENTRFSTDIIHENPFADVESWEDDSDEDRKALTPPRNIPHPGRHSLDFEYSKNPGITVDLVSDLSTSIKPSALPEDLNQDELIDEVHRLRKQLHEKEQILREAKNELGLEKRKRSYRLDDEYFRAEMIQLQRNIKEWARTHFTNQEGYVTKPAAKSFQHLTENHEVWLLSKPNRRFLIEARVWDLLLDFVINPHPSERFGYVWAGRLGKRKRHIRDRGPRRDNLVSLDSILRKETRSDTIEYEEYHEWRSLTYNLLFPGRGRETTPRIDMKEVIGQRNMVTHKIWKDLKSYVTRANKTLAKDNLRDIVRDAMALDVDFKKQKADFFFGSWGDALYGYEFVPEHMEDLRRSSKRDMVQLMVSPGLFKRGDSSGHNYHKPKLKIVNARVICNGPNPSEKKSFLRNLYSTAPKRSKRRNVVVK
ncbi:uncharacterized protein BDZ99DRAFT_270302 [Mytilinidion resinicola]|uniref:Uncharacterized protein n=1 Tax=Mytilinidion resinicola TaxID=574789 RepID=A0A6A6YXB5_9PEZI|nr:uncharacterized protein BDZ99DRAFT_270302 [Mytilinidion resinicola]KAF2812624.1 hypothetical protein BDZ99DRAFT_270302 [Mytilinidion resinicola]